jgi:TRAP-type C4-dicarboxylate transport system permease small subunit
LFETFERALNLLSRACLILAGIAMVVLTVIFGVLVFGRYVLNETPTWVEQVSLLLVFVITFLGAAAGVHESRHLSVELFRDKAPKPVRFALLLVSYGVLGAFGIVMLLKSFDLMIAEWDSVIPLIGVPKGARSIPMIVCGVLIALFCLGHVIRLFRGIEPPRPDAEQTMEEHAQ